VNPILKFIGTVIILGVLALWMKTGQAAEDWLVVTVGSRHDEPGYNEKNWGIGVEHGLSRDWRALAGTYRNSYYRQTVYVGAARTLWRSGNWLFGITGMIVTGYGDRPEPVFFPAIAYEGRTFGVNFGPVLPSVVALQVKMRF